MTEAEILEKLKEGNVKYVESGLYGGDVSVGIREVNYNAQNPYAIIITCSDSRVIPEVIFSADLGDLFVIRVAGNVIDNHQLGSIEYAAEHLGTKLAVVLGHTNCGAINAAIEHDPDGYIGYITREIKKAIKSEKDPVKACGMNIKRSVDAINSKIKIEGFKAIGAIYDIKTGEVVF